MAFIILPEWISGNRGMAGQGVWPKRLDTEGTGDTEKPMHSKPGGMVSKEESGQQKRIQQRLAVDMGSDRK